MSGVSAAKRRRAKKIQTIDRTNVAGPHRREGAKQPHNIVNCLAAPFLALALARRDGLGGGFLAMGLRMSAEIAP